MSNTFAILSLALVASAQAWHMNPDFVRDVVSSSRRLEAHGGEGGSPDMAGCDKECPGFMKMFIEVGGKLAGVDMEDPEKLLAAMKEHVCPKKDDAACAIEKCDDATKTMLGGMVCMCDCGDKMLPLMKAGEMKTADDIKKAGCDKVNAAWSCMSGAKACAPMIASQSADDKKMMEEACPATAKGGEGDASSATRISAGLAAMVTAAVRAAEF